MNDAYHLSNTYDVALVIANNCNNNAEVGVFIVLIFREGNWGTEYYKVSGKVRIEMWAVRLWIPWSKWLFHGFCCLKLFQENTLLNPYNNYPTSKKRKLRFTEVKKLG